MIQTKFFKKIVTSDKINAILSNINNLLLENNKANDKDSQKLSISQYKKVNNKAEVSWT